MSQQEQKQQEQNANKFKNLNEPETLEKQASFFSFTGQSSGGTGINPYGNNNGKSAIQLKADNSPQVKNAMYWQTRADNSPSVQNAIQLQKKADNSPQVLQAKKFQEFVDNSPRMQKENTRTIQMFSENISNNSNENFKSPSSNKDSYNEKNKLPPAIQAKMENSFGHDFSDVNIFPNSEKPSAINALAFTQGKDIHFASGQYNPESQKGQELLGHELTHVVQQQQGRVNATTQMKGVSVNDSTELEKEADEMGRKAVKGEVVGVSGISNQYQIQKKEASETNKSDEPDFIALSKIIYKAINWLGTDEEKVYEALKKLNNNGIYIEKLKITYKNVIGNDLMEDLVGDFSGTELNKVISLLTPSKDINTVSKSSNNKPEKVQITSNVSDNRPQPTNRLVISSIVGDKSDDQNRTKNKQYNKAKDVKTIQDQLYSLGYFPEPEYKKEVVDDTQNEEIPKTELTLTIKAIRKFQQEVRGASVGDGIITPTGNDIKYLITATKIPSKIEADQIIENRKEFKIISKVSGEDELADGLSQEVGKTNSGNLSKDVKVVQKRLIELGFLSHEKCKPVFDPLDKAQLTQPGEYPDYIKKFYKDAYKNKDNIQSNHLTNTIKAIERFQKSEYDIIFWAKKLNRPNEYTIGTIKPGDVTFEILKYATKFTISSGDNKTATFKNYRKSQYTKNKNGIMYSGTISPNQIDLNEFKNYNLKEKEVKGLLEASSHEGNLDALNTYDGAIISYGFIQFAGGHVGSFAKLLAKFKEISREDFKNHFQKYGIDVEYNYSLDSKGSKTIKAAQLTIWDTKNNKLIRGIDAEIYLRDNVELLGILIKASRNVNMQKAQLEYAINDYAKPSLNTRLGYSIKVIKTLKEDKATIDKTYVGSAAIKFQHQEKTTYDSLKSSQRIKENEIDLSNTKISEIISSEKGIATLISLYINSPANAIKYSRESIKEVIEETQLDTLEKIKNLDDKKVIEKIREKGEKNTNLNKTFPVRIDKINESKLSYEK